MSSFDRGRFLVSVALLDKMNMIIYREIGSMIQEQYNDQYNFDACSNR